ncbi:MAG TPA: DUF4157 domain-containing protein, partial [Gemmatimonadaceae bacterium]|nr:DUF4157 domain-containing protein [Gemmatimonadaceae bacterium]
MYKSLSREIDGGCDLRGLFDGVAGVSSGVHAALRAILRETIGLPFALPQDVISAFPELASVSWRRGGFPLRVGGWFLGRSTVAGITFGSTVFLSPAQPPSVRLLLHELGHVRQYRRDKTFAIRYLWESVCRGYSRNRFEVEADQFAEEVLWSSTQRRP